MSEERWRCFVAVPVGQEVRAGLRAAADAWCAIDDAAAFRWTAPEMLHLTVAFLGDLEPSSVPALSGQLAEVAARHRRITAQVGAFGAFPTPGRARVLWCGLDEPSGRLLQLAADATHALGIEARQPYRPHITIARAKRDPVDVRLWLSKASLPPHGVPVDRMDLMRSHLGMTPTRYELLTSAPLGVPLRA